MKKIILLLSLLVMASSYAQQNFWSSANNKTVTAENLTTRATVPVDYNLYNLDTRALHNILAQTHESKNATVQLQFPLPDGSMETFNVKEHSIMEPGLQAKFPKLRAYKGVSTSNSATVIHFNTSPRKGFSGMIMSPRFSSTYIDPYTTDGSTYITYERNSLPQRDESFVCNFENATGFQAPDVSMNQTENANDGILRTYRLALACTGEYSIFHLDEAGIPVTDITTPDEEKKAVVMDALIVSMVRVNGLYERDFAIRMVFVDNNDEIIYLNPATDPHSNNDSVSMLATNQIDIDMKIGRDNYDIGHVYSTGAGGVAYLGVPCDTTAGALNRKAGGVTGIGTPTGDPFWVDYVAHEIGHQFGANHTQNNDCQRNGSTAMEPGSASTILGYAGICSPNVQNNSDDHFHAASIQEITAYMLTQNCEVQTNTNNVAPEVFAPQDFTIPPSTAFRLDAVATDDDTDDSALTYNWEQIDNEIGEVMPPAPTNTQGPMFRSISSLSSRTRFMPDLPTVLTGATANTWEVAPSVSRTMEFRVTVRDNELDGAATASDDVIVTVEASASPFMVTSQNVEETWEPNSSQVITWDMTGTDVAPISATTVNILYSNDGGLTYPVTLASAIPNNGMATIIAPNELTTTGRIMVEPTNNHFFDVNDANITIDGVLATEDLVVDDLSIYPNPSTGILNIAFTPSSNETIDVQLHDLRGRLIQKNAFENNGTFNQQLNYSNVSQGVYFVTIKMGDKQLSEKVVIE